MASDTTFYISLPDVPVYLKPRCDKSADRVETGNEPRLASAPYKVLFMINPPPCNDVPEKSSDSYIRSCLFIQRLYRHLVEHEELSSRFEFVLGAAFSMTTMGRQLYALRADDTSDNLADWQVLSHEARKQECTVWMYERDSQPGKPSVEWRLVDWKSSDSAKTITMIQTMPEVLIECVSDIPEVSPIFEENRFSPVFHDYARSMEVLNMYKESPEVQKLLCIAAEQMRESRPLAELQAMMTHPLIVVEGMDATGKTTLTELLEKKLSAARCSNPPSCLLPLRQFFDKLPEIMRRAYYSLGNYIVAQHIAAECQTRIVVMDRFWHSTAAYGIANETSLKDLPPLGHQDYCWPGDLLKPTVVVFLTVDEEVRRQRLGNRKDNTITFEERSLNKDQLFRIRLCEAYLRMREPACMQVDARGSKEKVVKAVLEQLGLHGVQL